MSGRKPIAKSVRFEVFKRDNFTCQYCGQSAPEVVLHLDHIAPVAGGGGNDIINLLTSCEPCNLGKGAKPLDDKSALAKQRAQLEELNQRREQLEMLLSWREGLNAIDEDEVDAVADHFEAETNCSLNDFGRKEAKKWIKRHGLAKVLASLDASLATYFKGGDPEDGEANNNLASKAYMMIPRIISSQSRDADRPWMKDLYYCRAIIRNRHYCNDQKAIALLEEAYAVGISVDDLKRLCKGSNSWTAWHRNLQCWIDEESGE